MDRTLKLALASLTFNIAFATYHLVMGLITSSWWLLTLGSYYLILSIVRFVVIRSKSKERFITKFTGWMLITLSIPLAGTVILSIVRDRGHELHMIVMIGMAAYAFTKITLATIKFIKARHSTSATLITLRNISLADAFVSIFALQRSMLVSFEGMTEAEMVIMNATLGSAVCVIVFLLGLNLVRNRKILFKSIDIRICEDDALKNKMILITAFLFVGFAISLPIFVVTKNAIVETVTITIGVTLYHFVMRLAVGTIVNSIMKNKANHNNIWFREKSFEIKLYRLIRVREWKKHLPTYSPDTFDTSQKTVQEIVGATCQAEIVHEIIMALSLLPIALIPFLGGAATLIITSVLAMLFDSLFVIIQRYNRPKLVRIMGRFQKLKNSERNISESDGINH